MTTHLPSIAAILALTKRRHRFVGAPRLRLVVGHFLLLAPAALETGADAAFGLGHLGVLHVFLLELLVLLLLLDALEVFVRHGDEAGGGDFAREDARAEGGVLFVLQILEEGADFGFVRGVVLGAKVLKGGGFDGGGDADDGVGSNVRGVGEAVVKEADAAVPSGLVGAVNGNTVFLVVSLVERDGRFGGFLRCGRRGGRSREGHFLVGAVGGL